jgi:putative ABC transport system permease protein
MSYRFSKRLYRLFLLAFPARFRVRFGTDMERDFIDLLDASSRHGFLRGRLKSWYRVIVDLTTSVPREHVRNWQERRRIQTPHLKKKVQPVAELVADIRYALRGLRKNPGFMAGAVITLALGIGANTAIFSLVDTVLLQPLPYDEPDRLVMVWEHNLRLGMERDSVGAANYADWRDRNKCFEQTAAFSVGSTTLTAVDTAPERLRASRITPSFFSVLRLKPSLGRVFHPEEAVPGNDKVVILSHELWQSRFGSGTHIIGRKVTLDGESSEVIGIMPPHADLPRDVALWTPLALSERLWNNRGSHFLQVVARLAPGVTLEQARSSMEVLAESLRQEYPNDMEGFGVNVVPLHQDLVGELRPALLLLQGAVLVLLLIACANVTNLQFARGNVRRAEMALRTALGASRGRLLRQLLAESLLLSLAGAVLGLLVAMGSIRIAGMLLPGDIARFGAASLDLPVLGFTLVVAVVSGLVSGVAPALRGSSSDLSSTLKEGGRSLIARRGRLRHTLVVAEVGLSLVLLVGAGLLFNSFVRLLYLDPGIEAGNILTMRVSIPRSRYVEPPDRVGFFRELSEKIQTLPGVRGVGLTNHLPVTGQSNLWGNGFHRVDDPPQSPADFIMAIFRRVSPDYFSTMGFALQRGRILEKTDTEGSPHVIVIDQAMADTFFPNEDPMGKRLVIHYNAWEGEIVGIVGNVPQTSLREPAQPHMYVSHLQTYKHMFLADMDLAIRTDLEPHTLVEPVRRSILEIDAELAPYQIQTMEERVWSSLNRERFNVFLLGTFAVTALFLAAVGLFGVIAFLASQRSHEIGIRMALGARRGDVLSLMMRYGAALTGIGVAIGVLLALALSRLLESFLYGVTATDPMTIFVVSGLLGVVALTAILIPAHRASRVDPLAVLRYE